MSMTIMMAVSFLEKEHDIFLPLSFQRDVSFVLFLVVNKEVNFKS